MELGWNSSYIYLLVVSSGLLLLNDIFINNMLKTVKISICDHPNIYRCPKSFPEVMQKIAKYEFWPLMYYFYLNVPPENIPFLSWNFYTPFFGLLLTNRSLPNKMIANIFFTCIFFKCYFLPFSQTLTDMCHLKILTQIKITSHTVFSHQ